jgi:gluconokinase
MHIPGLRSPHAKVGGLVYFGRMLDKIRLHAADKLPAGYNVGTDNWWDFDARCTRFLGISYEALAPQALRGGFSDKELLQWCFREGRKPNDEEIEIWNTFMQKRGWNDGSSKGLKKDRTAAGLGDRDDIVTWFDLFDADEQPPRKKSVAKSGKKRRT